MESIDNKLLKKAELIAKRFYGNNYELHPSGKAATYSPTPQHGYYMQPTVWIDPKKMTDKQTMIDKYINSGCKVVKGEIDTYYVPDLKVSIKPSDSGGTLVFTGKLAQDFKDDKRMWEIKHKINAKTIKISEIKYMIMESIKSLLNTTYKL